MRISDWSSDVCSADLRNDELFELVEFGPAPGAKFLVLRMDVDVAVLAHETHQEPALALAAILATPHLADQMVGQVIKIFLAAARDDVDEAAVDAGFLRSEEHTSELQH